MQIQRRPEDDDLVRELHAELHDDIEQVNGRNGPIRSRMNGDDELVVEYKQRKFIVQLWEIV